MAKINEPKANILIVDDTPANLRLLALMLNTQGYRIRIAEDGPRALESVRANPPDLMLLDVMMPGMNGYEVCMQLRGDAATRDIPIIFISALDDTQNKINAFTAGGVDYVTKPFHVEEVLARVETHLALRDLQKQLQAANCELAKSNAELEQRVAARTAELAALNAAYQRFVPQEFLAYLNKPSVVEVQLGDHVQRDMTVLRCNIQAFTARSELMTPQASFDFLNAYLGQVTPIIREHQGIVDQYLDDGVMALFSGTADQALQAAIAMQRPITEYNRQLLKDGLDPIMIGVGLHTGDLTLGIIGDTQRLQGAVISDAVDLAARLQELCKVYGTSIIASGQTVARLTDAAQYGRRFVDKVEVRGEEKPIAAYEILDGETESTRELKLKTRKDFEEGLQLLYNGKFGQAHGRFTRVLEQNPDDPAAQIYLQRSANSMHQFSVE